jgi:hypothetical protein
VLNFVYEVSFDCEGMEFYGFTFHFLSFYFLHQFLSFFFFSFNLCDNLKLNGGMIRNFA